MYINKHNTLFWLFLLLIPLVIILQYLLLKPHLKYAFADVDWMFLLDYKQLNMQYQDPLSHIMNGWKKWGVYTYQIYYIGLIEHFFGFDYKNFQMVTLAFKIIATLSIFPLVFILTKSKLAAFLTTIIYSAAYPSVGVMYTVVTSGLFVAIPVMIMFFIWYWYLVNKPKNSYWQITIGVILFFLTLLLATERMYPLVPTVFFIELFIWFKSGYSKKVFLKALKRVSILLILFLLFFLYKASSFTMHSGNTAVTYQKFMSGNWHVILSPVISLGSLFLPRDYWILLGAININGLAAYVDSLISGPFLFFSFISIILSFFLPRKKIKFVVSILLLTLLSAFAIYVLSTNHLKISEGTRMNFDFAHIIPALIGCYVIFLNIILFKEWIDNDKRDNLIITMVGGMVVSFVFILLTWIPADYVLVFTGVHRYLTIPAIGSSLFLAGLITLFFNKLRGNKITYAFSYLVFLILIPLLILYRDTINTHLNYELNFAGTDATAHIRMKGKLWSYLTNFSNTDPSIFYFDESKDYENGYFDETTIMAGFNYWMRFRGRDIADGRLTPMLLRSNLICPVPRSMCLDKVIELITEKDGVKGILYGDVFYKPQDFYAFRFVNRDIVDIKPEIVKLIGLE